MVAKSRSLHFTKGCLGSFQGRRSRRPWHWFINTPRIPTEVKANYAERVNKTLILNCIETSPTNNQLGTFISYRTLQKITTQHTVEHLACLWWPRRKERDLGARSPKKTTIILKSRRVQNSFYFKVVDHVRVSHLRYIVLP